MRMMHCQLLVPKVANLKQFGTVCDKHIAFLNLKFL